MQLEADRIVTDWLSDPTDGVNALLASTPRDSGDPVPAAIAAISDETRDGNVARGELPADFPAIGVEVDVITGLDGQVQTVTADGRVKLRIRVGVATADTAEGKRDLSYIMRTVVRSLRRFFTIDANDARRTRNQVYLETCHEITWGMATVKDAAGNTTIAGYVFPVLQLRDLSP